MFSMKVFRKKRQRASALLLGLFLFLQALSISPALHALVHSDAAEAGHECAVTLFTHGQINASATAVPIVCTATRVIFCQSPPQAIFVSADVRLLPGRGPPASPALV
jgi:hypothetical protein